MSTLRVSNIEAKADASSPTIDEKVKVTSSQGRVLVQIDGKTAGITSIGINTTSTSFTIDANQNVQFVGVITAANVNTTGVSTFTRLNVGTGGTIIATTTSGLVGVGTINPQYKLHVSGSSPHVLVQGDFTSTAANAHSRIYFNDYNFGIGCGNFGSTSDDDLYLWAYNGTGRDIKFCSTTDGSSASNSASWTTNMIIKNDGKIGMGITNPTTDLQILKTVSGGNGALLSLVNKSSTLGTKCGIMFGVDNSDANWTDVGNGTITVENADAGNSYGIMKFRVYDGADSEAIKICGNGIAHSPADGGGMTLRNGVAFANAGVAIDSGWASFPGIMVFNENAYGNTNRGEFRIHGWNRSYSSYPASSGSDFGVNVRIDGSTYFSSDARHKTNIIDNPYGLNEILQLQPRKFNRINSEGTIEEDKGDILGFIAQEVREIIPEAVNYYPEEDTPNEIGWCRAYALSEGYILSTLVNAVKEQNIIIETLKSRIETLESQINT